MKVGFVSCVTLGLSCMQAIYRIGGKLDAVISLHDQLSKNKSGRIVVDAFCKEQNIDQLIKINHINDAGTIDQIRGLDLDWLLIIGWSQIASKQLLEIPRYGVLGMHPTLLPEGRGRASIPWAILKGLDRTGVSLFKLSEGVDEGPIVAQQEIPIDPASITANELYQRVNQAHEDLIQEVWPKLQDNSVCMRPQNHSIASYWPGRSPEDGEVNEAMSVDEVERLVRAVGKPYPGAYASIDAERQIRIWAGQPFSQTDTAIKGYQLNCRDGIYRATDYVIERKSMSF